MLPIVLEQYLDSLKDCFNDICPPRVDKSQVVDTIFNHAIEGKKYNYKTCKELLDRIKDIVYSKNTRSFGDTGYIGTAEYNPIYYNDNTGDIYTDNLLTAFDYDYDNNGMITIHDVYDISEETLFEFQKHATKRLVDLIVVNIKDDIPFDFDKEMLKYTTYYINYYTTRYIVNMVPNIAEEDREEYIDHVNKYIERIYMIYAIYCGYTPNGYTNGDIKKLTITKDRVISEFERIYSENTKFFDNEPDTHTYSPNKDLGIEI